MSRSKQQFRTRFGPRQHGPVIPAAKPKSRSYKLAEQRKQRFAKKRRSERRKRNPKPRIPKPSIRSAMASAPLEKLKSLWNSQVMDEEQWAVNYVRTPSPLPPQCSALLFVFLFSSRAIALIVVIALLLLVCPIETINSVRRRSSCF